ncbi:MAG: error-prone DNA polymerase [Gammaproteobacteria bacterium]|nr:MAG: error-prone DNA polymerase [Gammaproteobacteria bacterium]
MDYAELHCLSNYSFLRGASHPEELVARAAALGYRALALTDECSVAGVVKAHLAARDAGLKLIVGSEFQLEDGPKLVLLAPDRRAYGQLSTLITLGRRRSPKGRYQLTLADLERGLDACLALWLPDPHQSRDANDDLGSRLKAAFLDRLWIALELFCEGDDLDRTAELLTLAIRLDLPMTAAGDVHLHDPARKPLQDILTAIRLQRPVAELGRAMQPNRERCLQPIERLRQRHPPELLAESVAIAERCQFSLDELRYEYPEELIPPGTTASGHLRALTLAGARRRWPEGMPAHVSELVEKELALIRELGYEHFFLTVHDVVAFARDRGILCQGRGSAANSAVCYCLGITEVDPGRMSVLFERFISKERNEPPDIDVDFEHQRREEVIQYLYRRYGRDRAALAATLITYRPKSAIRDVGKALGLDPTLVDALAKSMAWWEKQDELKDRFAAAGVDPDSPVIRRCLHLVRELLGFPRHLSQHVGGFVISQGPLAQLVPIENAAMAERTLIQWDKDDLDALGLLKVDVLALGMLSAISRSLALISDFRGTPMAMEDVPAEDPETYAMLQKADSVGVFQVESRAQMAMLPRLKPDCFYDLVVEVAIVRPGPIQGDMVHPYLRRRQGLEPVTYPNEAVRGVLERTLGVPIFQEQVIQLAMVAAGFSGGEADALRRAMAAWRRRGGLEPFRDKLVNGMLERGHDADFAERLFAQICGFGEYGFPESHAASFALLVYVSAWLKRHEPAAFCCGLLNSLPMGFYSASQLIQDVRRHGVEVRPVDVLASHWDHGLERSDASPGPGTGPDPCGYHYRRQQGAIRLGLRQVTGFNQAAGERIVAAREVRPFETVQDLARRARLDAGELRCLAEADALRHLAGHRHQSHWETAAVKPDAPLWARAAGGEVRDTAVSETVYGPQGRGADQADTDGGAFALGGACTRSPTDESLHGPQVGNDTEPSHAAVADAPLDHAEHGGRLRDGHDEGVELPAPTLGSDVLADYASLGLTLNAHPMALLRRLPAFRGCRQAGGLGTLNHGRFVRIAGLVTGRQRPSSASGVLFLTLEDETGNHNVVIWNSVLARFRGPILGGRLLLVKGVLEREGRVIHVVAGHVADYSHHLGELRSQSRDFH